MLLSILHQCKCTFHINIFHDKHTLGKYGFFMRLLQTLSSRMAVESSFKKTSLRRLDIQ